MTSAFCVLNVKKILFYEPGSLKNDFIVLP